MSTQVVLVRVHASNSDLFSREEEIATFRAVGETGVGPRLLLLFGNGRVEEFLEAHVTLTAADMRQPDVSAAIAAALAAFHIKLVRVGGRKGGSGRGWGGPGRWGGGRGEWVLSPVLGVEREVQGDRLDKGEGGTGG